MFILVRAGSKSILLKKTLHCFVRETLGMLEQ